MIEIEVCLFNSLSRYAPRGEPFRMSLPRGTAAAEIPRRLRIPSAEIFVAWKNGRNIMTTFGGMLEDGIVLEHGDRLALSGPVPFSRAYGAPVC